MQWVHFVFISVYAGFIWHLILHVNIASQDHTYAEKTKTKPENKTDPEIEFFSDYWQIYHDHVTEELIHVDRLYFVISECSGPISDIGVTPI